MKRYCHRCSKRLDSERIRRGSIYHSDECRRLAKNEARDAKAGKKCRLCSRNLTGCCEELRKELNRVRRAHKCKYAVVTTPKTKGAAA
jgi:hypothetical protein